MEVINAIGRRKSAVARVYVSEGNGKITINKRDITEYFPSGILQYVVKQPLNLLEVAEKYDIKANLDGGGYTGYPGGQRFTTPAQLRTKEFGMDRILRHAVKGMLPKGRLGRQLLDNLYVYNGTEHPHEAQKPKAIDINQYK